eukprot:1499597-Lingulodinium_polyedra.AAC.1
MEAQEVRPRSPPILRAARWERAGQPKRSGLREPGELGMRDKRRREDRPRMGESPNRPPSPDGDVDSRRWAARARIRPRRRPPRRQACRPSRPDWPLRRGAAKLRRE